MWASVRAYGDEATELLKRFEELCRPHRGDVLPEHDLVQGDLNLGNLLVDDGRIRRIVDIEAAGCG